VVFDGYCIIAHNWTIAPDIAYSRPLFARNSSFICRFNHRFVIFSLIGCVERHPGSRAPSADRRNIKWGLLNIRSTVNKAAQIHDKIESESLDILVLTEAHILFCAPPAIKNDIAPEGYLTVHSHRTGRKKKAGGGIAVIYRDSLDVKEIKAPFISVTAFETLCACCTRKSPD
jgi:hypothetical protein